MFRAQLQSKDIRYPEASLEVDKKPVKKAQKIANKLIKKAEKPLSKGEIFKDTRGGINGRRTRTPEFYQAIGEALAEKGIQTSIFVINRVTPRGSETVLEPILGAMIPTEVFGSEATSPTNPIEKPRDYLPNSMTHIAAHYMAQQVYPPAKN